MDIEQNANHTYEYGIHMYGEQGYAYIDRHRDIGVY